MDASAQEHHVVVLNSWGDTLFDLRCAARGANNLCFKQMREIDIAELRGSASFDLPQVVRGAKNSISSECERLT